MVVTVHDENELPLANAAINGTWSAGYSGSSSCVTDSDGACSMTTEFISNGQGSAIFAVDTISLNGYAYESAANHDPDGDSDGNGIVVTAP